MIRMVRTVALLSALALGAVAGPVRAAAPTAPDNPTIVGELLDGVLAPLAPVVDAVLAGFDEAFTVGGRSLIRLFVPAE